MKKLRFSVVALACFTAVSLSAQTPPPSPGQAAGSSAKSSDAQKVTVSGCLERAKDMGASAGTSGTAGTAGATASASASSDSSKYVLNNVASSPASATGTSGADRPTASSYRLDGDDAKLSPHVGHKIEVTGSVENRASATGASMSASAPKLKVESIKMIASSCTP